MKVCKSCKKEFNDELTFCPFCGTENADKKLTYIEKKKAREKDQEFILSKAEIQQKDIDEAEDFDTNNIYGQKMKFSLKKERLFSILRLVLFVVIIAAAVIAAEIALKQDMNDNLKLLIIVVAFFAVAIAASFVISDAYKLRAYIAMSKEDFKILKLTFGKDPVFAFNGDLYELKCKGTCLACGSEMHVELVDDKIFAICNSNREHLYKVDREKFIEGFKTQIEQK